MNDNQAGPSKVKRRRTSKKPSKYNIPLTEEQLLYYLENSDDDLDDPDFEVINDTSDSDSNSDNEVNILNASDDDNELDLDHSIDIPDRPQAVSTQQIIENTAKWDSVADIPTGIPFSKQKELLVLPNGKL